MICKFKDIGNSLNQISLECGRNTNIWKQKSRSNNILWPITVIKNGGGTAWKSGIKQLFSSNIYNLQALLQTPYASVNFSTNLTRRYIQGQATGRRREFGNGKSNCNKQNSLQKRKSSHFSQRKEIIETKKSNKIVTDKSYLNQLKNNIQNVLEKQIQQIGELQSKRVRKDINSAIPLQKMVVDKIREENKPGKIMKLHSNFPTKINNEKSKDVSCSKLFLKKKDAMPVPFFTVNPMRVGTKNKEQPILDNFKIKYKNEPNNKINVGNNNLPKQKILIHSNNSQSDKGNNNDLMPGKTAIPISKNAESKVGFPLQSQSVDKSTLQTNNEVKDPTALSMETIKSLRDKMGIETQNEKFDSKNNIHKKMNTVLEEMNSQKTIQHNFQSEKLTDVAHQPFPTKDLGKEKNHNSLESSGFKPLFKNMRKVNSKKLINSNNPKTIENIVYKHETYLPIPSPHVRDGNNGTMPEQLRHIPGPSPNKSKVEFSHKSVFLRDHETYRKFKSWDRERRLRTIYNTHWNYKNPKGFDIRQVSVPKVNLTSPNQTKPVAKPAQNVEVYKLDASSLAERIRQRAKIINKNRIKDEVLQPQIYCRKSIGLGLSQMPILPCKNMLQADVTDHLRKKKRIFLMNTEVRKRPLGNKLYKQSQKNSRPLWKRQKMISTNEGTSAQGISTHGKNRGIIKKRKLDFKGALKYIMNLKSRLQSQSQ